MRPGRPFDLTPRCINGVATHFHTGDGMRLAYSSGLACLLAALVLFVSPVCALSQGTASGAEVKAVEALPEAPAPQSESTSKPAQQASAAPEPKQQPKRILGLMPNYRAVSAGETPPPPTPRQAFKIATLNSFDYSSFAFVGLTSLLAEGSNAHPKLGKGVAGYGRYYWRGYLDKTDGNYLVIFALPTVFHQDERYFAKGEGNIFSRGVYASSRILITPDYHGHNGFNTSEILGRGIAEGISLSYYPSSDRTAGKLATKYAFSLSRDALTNTFREFWPDIAAHLRHLHQ